MEALKAEVSDLEEVDLFKKRLGSDERCANKQEGGEVFHHDLESGLASKLKGEDLGATQGDLHT